MSVAVIGLSHRTSPVTVRERFAFADTEIPAVLAGLRATGLVDEAVILSTCNRVELYAAGPREAGALLAGLREFLLRDRQCDDTPESQLYTHAEGACVEHLF